MVDVSDKVLEDAKNWLIKTSSTWVDGVCKGECRSLDGQKIGSTHTACHAWVTHSYSTQCFGGVPFITWNRQYAENAKNFLVLSCHSKVRSKNICSPEACDFLVLWVAKESPFSRFILNRDDERSLTEGGVILLCGPDGLTLAQAMWVCKVLRFITEGAKAADTFMTLVKGGVDPMLSVLVASHIRSIKGATFGYTGLEFHSTVFGGGGVDVAGLLLRNLNTKAACTNDVFIRPKNLKIGSSKSLANPTTKIKSFCKPFKKPDGWGGLVEGEGANEDELVTRVLEWQAELANLLPAYDTTFPPVLQPDPPMPDSNTVYLELDL